MLNEEGLRFGLDVIIRPGRGPDELLEARNLAVADAQRNRLDTLTLGTTHHPLEVGVGVVLRLHLTEEGGELLVELDQLLGRGAHVVRCHGGSVLTKRFLDDESADSRML